MMREQLTLVICLVIFLLLTVSSSLPDCDPSKCQEICAKYHNTYNDQSENLQCVQVPGALVQVDAGNGQVFGVNEADNIYTLYNGRWTQIAGGLIHVTVGPAGVWGVNKHNYIYKLVGGVWIQTSGLLKQIDAGGDQFISGVNRGDGIYCLPKSSTVPVNDGSPLPWVNIAGSLKYYSCGPLGCWGVNANDDIYYRTSVTPDHCAGSEWRKVEGFLAMIEVGTDGSVYGVNGGGNLYRRNGITEENPLGTSWMQLTYKGLTFRHVSVDLRLLWLITADQKIYRCQL